jgi:hypothetical protein
MPLMAGEKLNFVYNAAQIFHIQVKSQESTRNKTWHMN